MLDTKLIALDTSLYDLVRNINILSAVNPINYRQEKNTFFASNCSVQPQFQYKTHSVNVFTVKRALFNLPVETIQDEDLHILYTDVINSYVDKVDQFNSIGSREFLYDSLRYYGEPTNKDMRNAQFILHLPGHINDQDAVVLSSDDIRNVLVEFAEKHGYQYQLRIDDNMIANALVTGNTIKINSTASLSFTDTHALAHHELGVHLVTTLNARKQPLRIMEIGTPLNTMTQEGLAILSEYFSGTLSVRRLKILALRVIAVDSMIHESNFRDTFLLLKEQHGVDSDLAFTITARVYRGGGFTKDYLYLQGFHKMLNAFETEPDYLNLLTGKASIKYLPKINRLVNNGILNKPELVTPSYITPVVNDPVQQFVAHAIK